MQAIVRRQSPVSARLEEWIAAPQLTPPVENFTLFASPNRRPEGGGLIFGRRKRPNPDPSGLKTRTVRTKEDWL